MRDRREIKAALEELRENLKKCPQAYKHLLEDTPNQKEGIWEIAGAIWALEWVLGIPGNPFAKKE